MSDNNVLKLSQPSTFSDPLTEVLRSGARSLLARAVEAERNLSTILRHRRFLFTDSLLLLWK